MNEWIGWLNNEWMNGRMDRMIEYEWMDSIIEWWMNERKDGQDGWMMNEWMEK